MLVWLLLPAAGYLWLAPLARESWSGVRGYFSPRDARRSEAMITAEIARLRQAGDQLSDAVADGLREIPLGEVHSAIYDSLNARAVKFGVRMLQIKPLPLQPQDGFRVLAIELRLEAEFSRMLRFLHAIEQQGAGLQIQTITFQPAQPDRVAAALTIRALLQ